MCIINKDGSLESYGRIELFPNAATAKYLAKDGVAELGGNTAYLYTDAQFNNWYPGLLLGLLSQVSTSLKNEQPENFFLKLNPKKQLAQLKNETLYIPEYSFSCDIGLDQKDQCVDSKKLLSKYGFEIKVISAKGLSDKIMSTDKDLYILLYTQSLEFKFINVWNTTTGDLLYKRLQTWEFKLDKYDFKKLTKAIEKA